jgi:hypothetical protein
MRKDGIAGDPNNPSGKGQFITGVGLLDVRDDTEKDVRGHVFGDMGITNSQIDEAVDDREIALVEQAKRMVIQIARALNDGGE